MAEFAETKLPCPCGSSSDAFARRDDGGGWCFSCAKNFFPDQLDPSLATHNFKPSKDRKPMAEEIAELIASSEQRALPKRGITQATAKALDYRSRVNSQGVPEHLALYKDAQGAVQWIKVRNAEEKDFAQVGDHKHVRLYGLETIGQGGKMVVLTEGELDRVSVSQVYSNKWPVLSIAGGVTSAAKDVATHLELLLKFEKVVIAFDMDPVGQKAAIEVAKLFPPGLAHIAKLPAKDPNKALMDGLTEQLTFSLWNAPEYRPDGIVSAVDLVGLALSPPVSGLSWPWATLTDFTYGRRYGELYTLGAGTGIGKSDFFIQVVAHTLSVNMEPCAVFNYEASPVNTLKAVAGKLAGRRFHIPDPEHTSWTTDELRATLATLTQEYAPLYLNDHFGAVDWASVKERIRFLRHAHNVRHFFIDPITALVAQEEDERRTLDGMVAEMAQLCVELQVCLYVASHLTRPSEGKPHEEGGRVQLKHFRGSNAIGMWSFFVFGMERNQQAEDEEERAETTIRVLKDRYTGNSTGLTHKVVFNKISGILEPLHLDPNLTGGAAPPPITHTGKTADGLDLDEDIPF